MLALHTCVMSSFLVHEMGKVPLAGAVVRMTQDKVGLAPGRSEHPGATGEHPGAQVELGAPAHHAFSSSRTPPPNLVPLILISGIQPGPLGVAEQQTVAWAIFTPL